MGTQAYFGGSPPITIARNIVAKFPTNSITKVFYHPDSPELSVLIPGPNRYTFTTFLIGPFSWLMAIVFWHIK